MKNYDFTTRDLTLEVLNIGQNDVDSLTVTVPSGQKNVTIEGPNTYVIGSLSSNDFTTADFNVLPNKADINLTIDYNDITGVRRTTSDVVSFNPEMFRKPASSPVGLYVLIALVVVIVAYVFYRRHKKNKKKKLLRE
ncbi:MAG: hypothetical protein M1165_01115 [Candidatus Pacearchaeota archaeon]|nr:hypothetical protein [Candidatus Pacearchaeota archaeon]